MSDNSRKFFRAERGKYSLEKKNALGELIEKCKEEYDKQFGNSATQINYNEKMRKHRKKNPHEGFVAWAVREFYDDLKDVIIHDDPKFTAAVKLGKGCHRNLIKREEAGKIMEPTCSKSKY